jgi:osmotically-inducible protein OsmY
MKLRYTVAVLAALVGASGCAYHGATGETYPENAYAGEAPIYTSPLQDTVLTDRVQRNIATSLPGVAPDVAVSTTHGTVTLTGTVPTPSDRTQVYDVARNTPGVYGVIDQLQVPLTPTGSAVGLAYPGPFGPVPAPGEVFNLNMQGLTGSDRVLAQRILQNLQSSATLPTVLPRVNINVSGGRVILHGRVNTEAQREAITSSVAAVAGANNVVDDIRVGTVR